MKNIKKVLLISSLGISLHAGAQELEPQSAEESRSEFADAKFGIFLHWGIYSMFGQGEWYMQNAGIDRLEYAKAANAFYPHDFDARAWVSAFKDAGARYVCFTSRHHDGFSMWDTAESDFNIMHTPFRRDVVKELADACHAQNMRLHLYYSHIDWMREDYPMGRTGTRTGKDPSRADWTSYYAFMNRQLTELLTKYGRIGAIWFDGHWDHDQDSVPFDWQLASQYEMIHKLQPACLVGNNHHRTPYPGEDIQLFERDVPGENRAGLSGQSVSRLPLETCQTMNGMWGYKVTDQNYKSAAELIRLLVRTSGKGANLLLNIGPQPDGNLPATALERLKEMGKWLRANGESIYGTTAGLVGDGENVVSTRKGTHLYVHLLNDTLSGRLSLPVTEKIKAVRTFPGGEKIKHTVRSGVLTLDVPAPASEGIADRIIEVELRTR